MAPKREPIEPLTLAAFRAESASPEEVAALIQHRLSQVQTDIKEHMAKLEELREEAKRWLAVTSGRSVPGLSDLTEGAVLVPPSEPQSPSPTKA